MCYYFIHFPMKLLNCLLSISSHFLLFLGYTAPKRNKYAQCGTLPTLMFNALYVITITLFFNLQLFLLCIASTSGM